MKELPNRQSWNFCLMAEIEMPIIFNESKYSEYKSVANVQRGEFALADLLK